MKWSFYEKGILHGIKYFYCTVHVAVLAGVILVPYIIYNILRVAISRILRSKEGFCVELQYLKHLLSLCHDLWYVQQMMYRRNCKFLYYKRISKYQLGSKEFLFTERTCDVIFFTERTFEAEIFTKRTLDAIFFTILVRIYKSALKFNQNQL